MKRFSIVLILLALSMHINAQDLKCYICEDCDNVDGKEPVLCGPTEEPPSSSTTEEPPTSTSTDTTGPETTSEEGSTLSTPTEETTPVTIETSTTTNDSPAALDIQLIGENIGPVAKTSAAAILLRNYRSISLGNRQTDTVYNCYKIEVVGDDNKTKMMRGCIAIPKDGKGCDEVQKQEGIAGKETKNCWTCDNDGCNGSATLKLSLLTLFTVIIIKHFV